MKKDIEIGAQLYTIRKEIHNIDDFKKALDKIRESGYQAIELAGMDNLPFDQLKDSIAKSNLNVLAIHFGIEDIIEDPDLVVTKCIENKCSNAVLSWLPPEYISQQGLTELADKLPLSSERLKQENLNLLLHNHDHEFKKVSGANWIFQLFEKIEPDVLGLELDLYWVQAAGLSPVDCIEYFRDRISILHLKDMAVSVDGQQEFAAIGKGTLNWKNILAKAIELNICNLVIEQDECYEQNPFECLSESYKNLTKTLNEILSLSVS